MKKRWGEAKERGRGNGMGEGRMKLDRDRGLYHASQEELRGYSFWGRCPQPQTFSLTIIFWLTLEKTGASYV